MLSMLPQACSKGHAAPVNESLITLFLVYFPFALSCQNTLMQGPRDCSRPLSRTRLPDSALYWGG